MTASVNRQIRSKPARRRTGLDNFVLATARFPSLATAKC